MLNNSDQRLSGAILQTIAYSDIFDYPLTSYEIHRYLTGIEASFEEVCGVLKRGDPFAQTGTYFTLTGREEIVQIRMVRERRSRGLMPHALRYGRMLGSLPFIRMVALTGSLAVMNVSGDLDFDYLLVTVPGRLWTARAFSLLFNRAVKLAGHTICPNLILSETMLHWKRHDLYSARELCQMIPISGIDVYQKLMIANRWVQDFLPNAYIESTRLLVHSEQKAPALQRLLELFLRGKLGDRFEKWEMGRKIARLTKQQGFGEETIFNVDVCQGNFDHHSRWTRQALEEKLNQLNRGEGLAEKA